MKNLISCFCFFLIFCTQSPAQSNEGTDFWLGFMEHVNQSVNTKVLMITGKQSAQGTVSMPFDNWSTSFSISPNQVKIITLPQTSETLGSEKVEDTGIHVTADFPVSVYAHQYATLRSEATVILPTVSLGMEYYVMTYRGLDSNGQSYPSQFLITAVEDETQISIRLSDQSANNRSAGSKISIQLDQGETYQVQSLGGLDGDMTGSYIIGNKPFALFGGAVWTEVPAHCFARDNLYEQMYPVSTWGKKFVSVPNQDAAYDVLRVMAAEDGTRVYQDGNILTSLDAGDFFEFQVKGEATFLEGNKPILLAQFNIGHSCNSLSEIGDPSMLLLNSVEQTRDTLTLYSSSFEAIERNFINIISPTIIVNTVKFDDQLIGNDFKLVPGNPNFSFAQLEVQSGSHTITSSGCGVIASAYGYGRAESYSYSAGASFRPINFNPIPEGACVHDTVFFSTGLPPERVHVTWDLGDGTLTNEHEPQHIYPNLGTYKVRLYMEDLCLNEKDTIDRNLQVSLRQGLTAGNDTLVCEGEPVRLQAADLAGARYEWTGPNKFFSTEQFPVLSGLDPSYSGTYSVVGIVSGCATFPRTQEIDFQALPPVDLGSDTFFCDHPIALYGGEFARYKWQNGQMGSHLEIQEAGLYTLEVTDELGCINDDSILVFRVCPPRIFIPTGFTPNGDGVNDFWSFSASEVQNFRLRVFDRWGKIVFETQQPDRFWGGRSLSGQVLPQGVYVWEMHYDYPLKDGRFFLQRDAGTVTLIR